MKNIMSTYDQRIPPYPGGDHCSSYDCSDGCIMYHITGTTKQVYYDYLSSLVSTGYTLYDRHIIRDNYFTAYVSGKRLVHVYFTSHDQVTRIVVDPNTTLYQRKKDTPDTADKATLYQMELDFRTIDCGMCYITQCADGSFFIIDSAHMNSTEDHIRLYKLLRSLTPEGKKITVAGWFFSHAHQDHIYKFMDFLRADYRDCMIECLYYNFPALTIPGSEAWKASDLETIREFYALVDEHLEIPRIKLHTGQRFFVRNLEFEVLATHEDLYPAPLTRFNDSSTVLLMTAAGCRTLFLGDSNVEESTIMVARYGSYMKSDIIQVAHHGYNGSNVGIYFCADAKVALYPTCQSRYQDCLSSEANRTVHRISKEIYLSGNGTVALNLPYSPGTATVYPKEIPE